MGSMINSSSSPSPSPVAELEELLSYKFNNLMLLEEALTHSSCQKNYSYERLEFLGDAALSLAFSNYVLHKMPGFQPKQLHDCRKANLSNWNLAKGAAKHGLFRFLRENAHQLREPVDRFTLAVMKEIEGENMDDYREGDEPKVLADMVESIAAAVYLDSNNNLDIVWKIFGKILEPLTLPELDISRVQVSYGEGGEIEEPIQRLKELCDKNHWPLPIYSIEKDGPAHEMKFTCSVRVEATDETLTCLGDVKSRKRDAENSAASRLLELNRRYLD